MPTILSIEDNLINVQLLRRYFRHSDLTLIEATTGEAGLASVLEQRPDVILLDYHLPDGDGCSVARAIRAIDTLADVPIIGLTGDDTPMLERQMLASGFDVVLTKPVSVVTLMQTLEQYLQTHIKDIA